MQWSAESSCHVMEMKAGSALGITSRKPAEIMTVHDTGGLRRAQQELLMSHMPMWSGHEWAEEPSLPCTYYRRSSKGVVYPIGVCCTLHVGRRSLLMSHLYMRCFTDNARARQASTSCL